LPRGSVAFKRAKRGGRSPRGIPKEASGPTAKSSPEKVRPLRLEKRSKRTEPQKEIAERATNREEAVLLLDTSLKNQGAVGARGTEGRMGRGIPVVTLLGRRDNTTEEMPGRQGERAAVPVQTGAVPRKE